MANFGNNNLLGNQKRRNFIYQTAVPRPRDRSAFAAQPVPSTSGGLLSASVPNTAHESPHKRFKSSHGLPGKRDEEFAAAEACRDLPTDAFDEELDAIDEDFDDDLLTAEQLDEFDRIASLELQSQRRDPSDLTCSLPQRSERLSVNVPFSSHMDPGQDFSDEDDALTSTQEYVFGQSTLASSPHTNFGGTAGFPVSSSRILQAPVITHPQERVDLVKPSPKDDSLLESFVDQHNRSNTLLAKGNVDCGAAGKTASLPNNSRKNHGVTRDHSEDGQMESLRKEIEKLKAEYMTASAKVKTLEEEKFCKDGEIRILRDSLGYFEAEEKKRQGEARAMEKERAREQNQHEKDLEKQVENLTTQIQFKDREISQLIEKNKKRPASSTETSSTPPKKSVNLSEVFPTGSSFFQKTSPETKVKSARCVKPSGNDLKTPAKQSSQRLSEGENSENSALSGTSSGTSTQEKVKTQRREAEACEREIVQLCVQSFPDVELVQNLLSPQDKECHIPFQNPESRTLNDGSIISLLTLDTPYVNSHNITQRTTINETEASHTLRLFDTEATSKLQGSTGVVMQKDPSTSSCSNSLVLQTLSGLLNHSQALSSKFKHHHKLPAAVNFLPLLESHIVHYTEKRTESNDDNILGTCLTRHSPTPDSPEPKDSSGFESEHAKTLAALQETALTSLRLLNILVLYSCEVCECILKSARVFNETDSNEADEHNEDMDTEDERHKVKVFILLSPLFVHCEQSLIFL